MPTTKKTPKRQARRKIQGTQVERMVEKDIQKHTKPNQKTQVNTQKGVDIFVRNGIRLDVEVKSASERTLYKDKHGNYRFRMGRFLIKTKDYLDADLFAFAVKEVNEKGKWTGRIKTYYIKSETIRNYLKDRGLYKTRENIKISINVVKNLQKTYLKPYFKLKFN